jgi:putative multicomponent Na+:H+ antiporter subunit B
MYLPIVLAVQVTIRTMNDSYIYLITALLPLAASMVVFQVNPYHALIIRGILGAVAALVYTVLGAADVALTEAMVGTLLAITLYAIAVRSSLVLRLGVLAERMEESPVSQLTQDLKTTFAKHYMRVELVPYPDQSELHQALLDKEVHAICTPLEQPEQPWHTTTRLRRIYEIIQAELALPANLLSYIGVSDSGEKQR